MRCCRFDMFYLDYRTSLAARLTSLVYDLLASRFFFRRTDLGSLLVAETGLKLDIDM